jgi:hypothetical protein
MKQPVKIGVRIEIDEGESYPTTTVADVKLTFTTRVQAGDTIQSTVKRELDNVVAQAIDRALDEVSVFAAVRLDEELDSDLNDAVEVPD